MPLHAHKVERCKSKSAAASVSIIKDKRLVETYAGPTGGVLQAKLTGKAFKPWGNPGGGLKTHTVISDGQAASILASLLQKLRSSSPLAKVIIERLERSSRDIHVYIGSSLSEDGAPFPMDLYLANGTANQPAGVYLNSSGEGLKGQDLAHSLLHELGHALQHEIGGAAFAELQKSAIPGSAQEQLIELSNLAHNDNPVAAQRGMPERPFYGADPIVGKSAHRQQQAILSRLFTSEPDRSESFPVKSLFIKNLNRVTYLSEAEQEQAKDLHDKLSRGQHLIKAASVGNRSKEADWRTGVQRGE